MDRVRVWVKVRVRSRIGLKPGLLVLLGLYTELDALPTSY